MTATPRYRGKPQGPRGRPGASTAEAEAARDTALGYANDAMGSADSAANAAAQAAESANTALGHANDTAADKASAEAAKLGAETARDAAGDYADAAALSAAAAQTGATVYASEAAGRAAVADGASYWVEPASAGAGLRLFRRVNSGTSTLLFTSTTTDAIEAAQEAAEAAVAAAQASGITAVEDARDAALADVSSATGPLAPDQATGRGAVSAGQIYVVATAAGSDKANTPWKKGAGAVGTDEERESPLSYTAGRALRTDISDIAPRARNTIAFLTDSADLPLAVNDDGSFDDYTAATAAGETRTVTAEGRAFAATDDLNTGPLGLTSGAGYVAITRATEDGHPIEAKREDGTYQFGLAPQRNYDVRDSGGKIYLLREGVTPAEIEIGQEYDGAADLAWRFNARLHDDYVSWWAKASSGSSGPAYLRRMSLLSGFRAALPSGVTRLIPIPSDGQSNADGAESATVVSTENPIPERILSWTADRARPGHIRPLGNGQGPSHRGEVLEAHALSTLVAAREHVIEGCGETQCTRMAYEVARIHTDAALVVSTHAIGSTGPTGAYAGTQLFKNMQAELRRLWEIAVLFDLEFEPLAYWSPHEGGAGASQASYLDYLTTHFQTPLSEWMAILTGGEITNVPVVTLSMANVTYNNFPYTEQALAQLQAANTWPDKFINAGVTYVAPTLVSGGHYTGAGAARIGSYLGRAIANFLLGRDVTPFQATGASIVAGNIELPLSTGHYGCGTPTVVSSIVTSSPAQHGIIVRDQATQAVDYPLSSVTVVGGNKIRCVPASPLPSGVPLYVGVAYYGTAGAAGGPNIDGAIRSDINDGSTDTDLDGASLARHIAPSRHAITPA